MTLMCPHCNGSGARLFFLLFWKASVMHLCCWLFYFVNLFCIVCLCPLKPHAFVSPSFPPPFFYFIWCLLDTCCSLPVCCFSFIRLSPFNISPLVSLIVSSSLPPVPNLLCVSAYFVRVCFHFQLPAQRGLVTPSCLHALWLLELSFPRNFLLFSLVFECFFVPI